MPSRRKKNIEPPPSFIFVTPDFGIQKINWRKVHSAGQRSHAAYWGGPDRHSCWDKQQLEDQGSTTQVPRYLRLHDDASSSAGCVQALTTQHRRPPKVVDAEAIFVSQTTRYDPVRRDETRDLQQLSLLPFEINSTGSIFEADLSTFEFLGEGFVKRFLMADVQEYPIMFNGYQLLNYAYSMAFSGRGARMVLLQLKAQLMRHILESMKSSDGMLSPRCLIAILALGAPVVCLVSQDPPNGRTIWDLIYGSMHGEFLCCLPESADAGRRALIEQIQHRQPLPRLLSASTSCIQNRESLALLKYISNHISISMATEPDNHMTPELVDAEDLSLVTDLYDECAVPTQWASPLTCEWTEGAAATAVEKQTLLLAGHMHEWLGTFLDRDGNRLLSTGKILEERVSIRRQIEGFLSNRIHCNDEAEARYECCRWATRVLLLVEKLSVPIRVAAKHVRISPRLTQCLRMTDLRRLWGVRRGLLFWVVAVCHFATIGQCFPMLCSALLAQFSHECALSSFCSDRAIKPLSRLKQFESLCCTSARDVEGSQLSIS